MLLLVRQFADQVTLLHKYSFHGDHHHDGNHRLQYDSNTTPDQDRTNARLLLDAHLIKAHRRRVRGASYNYKHNTIEACKRIDIY